jgi:predicted aspartyl protease
MRNDFGFKFRYIEIPPLGRIFFPLIDISLKTVDKGLVNFEFIVDTGADLTTLPFYMAERLGLNLKKAQKSQSQGIGGFLLDTWIVELPIYIKNLEFNIRASITSDNQTPFLLGRVDLLDKIFSWNFDSRKKKIIFSRI